MEHFDPPWLKYEGAKWKETNDDAEPYKRSSVWPTRNEYFVNKFTSFHIFSSVLIPQMHICIYGIVLNMVFVVYDDMGMMVTKFIWMPSYYQFRNPDWGGNDLIHGNIWYKNSFFSPLTINTTFIM